MLLSCLSLNNVVAVNVVVVLVVGCVVVIVIVVDVVYTYCYLFQFSRMLTRNCRIETWSHCERYLSYIKQYTKLAASSMEETMLPKQMSIFTI